MPPIVIDLRRTDDHRDVVHRAVQALAEGQLVVFPTETVYGLGASARSASAVDKIFEAKGRLQTAPLALAIKSAEEALDYVPGLGQMAQRLARRCWPGPVTLVVGSPIASGDQTENNQNENGLVAQLPQRVREAVAPNQTVGLRVPAHEIVLDTLRMLAGPIVLTSANLSGQPDAVTAQQAIESLGDHVALVLDDGPCRYGQPSTVVQVTDDHCDCLRAGVVGQSALDRLASKIILFVCTGNTCRSPMAEVLMRQLAAEKLACKADDLEQRGVIITSAGLAAAPGCKPSNEAAVVMKEKGLSLSDHESQPLTEKLVRHADLILTLTEGHRQAIVRRWPECSNRTQTLRLDGADVGDPIGGSIAIYRECAQQIENALKQRVASLDFP